LSSRDESAVDAAPGVGTTPRAGAAISPALLGSIPGLGTAEPSDMVAPGIQEQLSRSAEFDTDVVILGAGPAGYVAAIRAAQLGARTVIVEKGDVGGTCLNVGCIPTKVLLACVGVLDHVKNGASFGVKVDGFSLDIAAMMARKQRTVKQLVSGVEGLFRKNKVRLVRGDARIADPHTVKVKTTEGEETLLTDKILICTGSVPAALPLPGLEIGGSVWTSTEALEFGAVPKSILIIGAGAIGLESAFTFASLGSEVLVVEMMPQILPAADTETAHALQKILEQKGIKFLTGASAARAEDTPVGKRVFIKSGDKEEAMEFEKVLVAVGRRPATDGLGLEELGINCERRKILVNDHMQTNIPSIYAAGDCTGEPMLAHVAWTESIVAVEHAMGMGAVMNYSAFPACVYTTPECASVGLTEEQARERYRDVRVGKFTFSHNGKALGIGEAEGFVKFVSEPRYGQILGVHMVGPHVTDLITEAVVAMRNELTVDEVIATIHPHPTLAEVVQEAAMDVQDRSIHK